MYIYIHTCTWAARDGLMVCCRSSGSRPQSSRGSWVHGFGIRVEPRTNERLAPFQPVSQWHPAESPTLWHVNVCVCLYIYIMLHVCLDLYSCIDMYIRVYLCVYIYIYIHCSVPGFRA